MFIIRIFLYIQNETLVIKNIYTSKNILLVITNDIIYLYDVISLCAIFSKNKWISDLENVHFEHYNIQYNYYINIHHIV